MDGLKSLDMAYFLVLQDAALTLYGNKLVSRYIIESLVSLMRRALVILQKSRWQSEKKLLQL